MRHIFRALLCNQFISKNFGNRRTKREQTKLFYSTSSTHCDAVEDDEVSKKSNEKLEDLLDNAALGEGPDDAVDESDEWQTSPYPAGSTVNWKQSQARKALRPRVDPRETSIILFPGQGSQFIGMGRSLLKFPKARDLFEAANEILKFDLTKLMLTGPKRELDKTIYCQPAIFVSSLAAVEKLKEENPTAVESCMATAGFSLGELTALTFAGVLSFDAGLKLVKVRAEAMQLASDMAESGMAIVSYGPESELNYACLKAKEWCLNRGIEDPECRIAIYIGPHVKVVAGNLEAMHFIRNNIGKFKIRGFRWLDVSGAFHTPLMRPALELFENALDLCPMSEPMTTVYSGVTGKKYFNVKQIRNDLPKHLYKPFQWEQVMQAIYSRPKQDAVYPWTYTCGPGTVLGKFLKFTNAKASMNWTTIQV